MEDKTPMKPSLASLIAALKGIHKATLAFHDEKTEGKKG
jgi:hypothetical protein